jgi:hypothetical protein
MKNKLLLLIWLCLPVAALMAQNKDEQVIANAIRQLTQAMIDANQIKLDELTSEKLSYGHSSGLIEDKDAFITAIIDGKSGFITIDLTEQTISINNNVAIVRHNLSADTDNKGQEPGHINLGVMQVWQKDKGKWLLLARHATRLP